MAQARLREPEPKVGVVGQGVPIDDLPESIRREGVRALVEVGLAERLQDRGLARLEAAGSFEHYGRGARMSLREQPRATPKELIGGVSLPGVAGFAWTGSHERYGMSSIRSRRGFSVRPGIRPRFAMGRPSISFRSPVKSMGLASLIADPTAKESTGAPASLK